MKNLKKFIICIIIFMIIIISIILVLLSKVSELNEADISRDISAKIEKVNEYEINKLIKKIITNYFSYVQGENNTAIYKILNKDYIKDNKITNQNIFEFIDSKLRFNIIENVFLKDDYIYPIYYVEIDVLDENNNNQKQYIEIHLDNSTTSFEILFLKEEEYNKIINNQENKVNTYQQVLRNEYNRFSYYNN